MNHRKITFEELHQLVSEVDYIDDQSFPIAFTVDGVKYRAGIGDFNDEGASECGKDFTDFFYGYEDEVQYLSRIDDDDVDFDTSYGYETVMDVDDPDGMSFNGIGKMLKKCCNITESSDIQLYPEHSFNGRYYGVYWAEMAYEVVERERENIRQWKSELEAEGFED